MQYGEEKFSPNSYKPKFPPAITNIQTVKLVEQQQVKNQD